MTPEQWQQVRAVFDQAVDTDPSDRRAFLDRICAGDTELRRQVELLLHSDDDIDDFMHAPLTDLAALGLINISGRRIGPYQIILEIGHGGMGTVFLAERADGQYRRQVAIKLVNPGLGSEAIVRRFRNERQILSDLDHPNIARLLDGGATEDGLPYLVMEYVDGERIDSWCDSHSLSLGDRLKLFQKICAAVQCAHDKQVIHRDIKPGNIVVTAAGTPKLLDFGIAKVLNPELRADTTETTVGPGPMTPEYASPEQVRGVEIGPASDIYALGAVLYRLLTGRSPHTAEGLDLRHVARLICEQEPVKPSVAGDSRELAGDLDSIVLKALRKEPEARYGSAAELAADIGRHLNGFTVQARRDSLLYGGHKFLKRNRKLIGAAALSALVSIALITGIAQFRRPAENPVRAIAVLPFENLSHDPAQDALTEGISDSLIGELGRISGLRVIARASTMRFNGGRKRPADMARELNASALVQGSVLRSESRVRISIQLRTGAMDRILWTRTYDRELRYLLAVRNDAAKMIARQIGVQLTPEEESHLASEQPLKEDAYKAYLKGHYHLQVHTREGLEKSIQDFKEAIEADPSYAPAWAGLASAYYEISSIYMPSAEAMPRAKAAVIRALQMDGTLAEAHATLGQIQAQYEWRFAEAEKSYKRAIELDPSYPDAHLYYAWYLAEQGRFAEAIREAAEATRLDPLSPLRATNLAWLYHLGRRTDEAIARCRKILELDPNTPVAHYTLAQAYEQKKMFTQAIAEYQRARTLDPNCDQDTCLASLAHTYAVSGDKRQALDALAQFMSLSRKAYIDPFYVGLVYAGLGDKDRAFEWFEKSFQARSEELLFIKVEPRLDSLHSDGRFKSLVRRIGLPP